jgi:hypothetical protein
VPWLALKLPAWPLPVPAFSVSPTPPFLFPFTPLGGPGSVFRIYTMPTTTARIGIGFCVGTYSMGMATQFPLGNCLTVFPPIMEVLGVCSADDSEEGTRQDSLRNMIEDYNPAEYTPKFQFKSNIAIHPTEIISDWIDQQKDEWNNIKLPTPKLLKPKLQKAEPELTEEELEDPLFAENTKILGRKLWKQLDRKSWITIKPERHTFPYPVFPQPDENGHNKELADFKTQWQAWKDAPANYAKEIKRQQALYNQNCKGGNTSPDCARWNQNIVSLNALSSSAAQNVQAIEKNWEAIQSYKEIPKVLRKLFKDDEKEEGDMTRLGKQFKKYSDEIDTYVVEWLDANKRAVKKWKKFIAAIKEFFKGFDVLLEAFTGFTTKCPTCSVERGSSTTFLINLLLGKIKLPVIPAPRLPDILLDFSRIDISVQLPVPEIELQPVQMGYPDLPPPPDVSMAQVIVPGVPVIPILPKMPEIKIEVNIPELRIPVLPILLDPPGVPNVFVKIRPITNLLQKFLDLFCLIVQAFIPVPEHYLAGHVQQLTNRTKLFNIDFTLPSFSLNTPQVPEINDIAIVIESHLSLPTLVFEVLNETVGKFAELDQCIIDSMSAVMNGAPEAPPCPSGGSAFVPSTVAKEETKYSIVANIEEDYFDTAPVVTDQTLLASLEKSFTMSVQFLKTAFMPPRTNVFSTIASGDMSRWLTSVSYVDVGEIPTEPPTDFDVAAFQADQTKEFEREPAIYYFDPATGIAESITDFPLGQVTASAFADLGKDYNDEILYAIDDELYLKYRVVPTIDEDDLEKKYEQKHGGDYEDRFGKLTRWDFETFREKFAPAKNVVDFVEQSGTTFQFEQIFNGTHYFEWVVSDRPDFVFEVSEDSDDRKSLQWERNGFLIRPHPKQYEIRPMSSMIQDIKGSPIVYASPAHTIEKFKQSECDDPGTEKPFFATESLLVGIADYSRMEVRVPPIPGRPERIEEKVLHRGEEAIVEYGEVCLTRGEVERIAMEETELIDPRENTYFPHGARMELGNNDQVELEFFDGTEVTIHEYEKYTLRIFETEADLIRAFERLEQKNQYGFFQGFTKEGDSFFFQKYLHDPQTAFDFELPDIHVVGGTHVSAQMFAPVEIDASRTRDSEGTIARAWWDLYPAYDTDKDGDPTNDQDFPTDDSMSARDVLKVSLPPYETEGTSSVILHVEDENGNHAQETITIEVNSSTPELQEATVRGGSILGSVRDAEKNVPITVERNRWGEWESIRPKPILTDGGGDFSIVDLGTSGGIEITDFAQKEAFEILENGRPILINDLFDIVAQGANKTRPTSILLRDEQRTPVTAIAFSISGEANVVLNTDSLEFTPEPSVHVRDRDNTDNITFRQTTEGNVLISRDTTPLALIDKRGDFYGELSLGIRSETEETRPVVFEIFNGEDEVIGEFVINLGGESEIRVTREKKQGVRVDSN